MRDVATGGKTAVLPVGTVTSGNLSQRNNPTGRKAADEPVPSGVIYIAPPWNAPAAQQSGEREAVKALTGLPIMEFRPVRRSGGESRLCHPDIPTCTSQPSRLDPKYAHFCPSDPHKRPAWSLSSALKHPPHLTTLFKSQLLESI